VAALVLPAVAWASGGPAYGAGATATPPTIDGTITPAEWKDAPAYSLSFGGIPATVRFEHTATDLYVGVVVNDLAPGASPSLDVFFDNDHDGVKELGDDAWLSFPGSFAQDFFWSPAGSGGASHYNDSVGGGTNETVASSSSGTGEVTFEIRHPLCSADTAHDICATVGQTLGVDFQYQPTVGFYDAPGPNTSNPSLTWGDLLLATGDVASPTVSVTEPAAGSTLSGLVPVAATASDNVAVTSVNFRYFDGATFHNLGTDTTAPYTATFDSTTVADTPVLGGTVYATATDAAGNTTTVGNGVTVDNIAAVLSGSVVASPDPIDAPTSVDLTAAGNLDWAIWGYAGGGTSTSLAPDVRKAGGSAISNLTNIDPAPSAPLRGLGQFEFGQNPIMPPYRFSWFDGGSQSVGAGVSTGIQHNGELPTNVSTLGKGFSFDVPAGTAARILTVYVATNRASGQLTASLSDGSAPSYADTLPLATEMRSGVYTIRYAAASPGKTLHVQWVETVDNCARFRCDNAALYAVALSSDATDANLSADASVGMSGSNDALVDIPLRAFEPAPSGTTPAPINGLPINGLPINGLPINGLPINGLPINGLPINGLPINGLPINGLPINGLPINGLPINGLPINGLPLTTPGGWAAALAGTSLAGLPLQTVTLQQVLALSPQPAAIAHLSLGQLDLSNSNLGRMTIGALALGSTPINGLALPADALASLQAWCRSVVTPATNCTGAAIGDQSLFALALAGAPINGLPINGLPINGLPINGLGVSASPINGLPINGLDVSASPINGLPINGLPLNGLPINGLSLTSILTALAPDGSPSPFRAIKIADLAIAGNVITSCTGVVDCLNGTLGDAAAVGAIKSTAHLSDLGDTALGSLTLGDLHFYGTLTIGDLEQSLVGTNATLGDLIGLLVKRADVPWETLSPRLLSVFDTSRPRLHLTTSFNAGGTGVGTVSVQVRLPAGFDAVADAATLAPAGGEPSTLANPTVDGDLATWSIPSLALGGFYTFRLSAFSGTDVGPAQASVTVSAGGTTSTSSASFDVTDSFVNTDGLPTITPNVAVQQSAIPSRGDVDYYKVTLPLAGTRLLVHLTNLPADYDLALYSSRTTSVRTATVAGPGASLQDGTIPDESINAQGGVNAQLSPTALQDVPDPGIQAVQVSANRGADDEDVGMVSPGGPGYALLAVYGYNGASSPKPYSLRVTTQAPVTPTCNARSFPNSVGTTGAVPSIASMPGDLNTLILVNGKRIGNTYGGTSQADVMSALNHLAGDRTLGVSGAVIPVEGLAQSQYNTWDQNPCDVNAANAVANAIADEIGQVKAARPSLKYVVFAGGDDQIPFFRIPDLSRIANESGFAGSFGANEYYGALASGDLLTDNPYLDTRPIPASGRQLFVPDLIGGRLVEKPSQIVNAVSRYETSSGILARSTAFVSGYDFVTDGTVQVQSRLNTFLGTSPARTLINDTWSKSQLLAAAFPDGGRPAAINDWNGHYDNHQALAADGNQSNLITTTELTGPYALSGGIFFTMGCHAGFQTTDAIVGSASPDKLDWSEYFAGSGTSFVGNTGFGLGNTDSVAFSEELMAGFAGNLDGSVSIGEALANAKQSYYLGRTAFSSYDEKTLSEAELYGLPMYGVGVAPPAVGAPVAPAPAVSPDPVRGAASSTSPSQGTLTALPATSAEVASFDVVPTFTAQSGSHGQYLTNAGQVQAPNYRPLQPFVSLPATRTGTTAHGVLVDGLTSSDLTSFNPDNVRPTLDLSANEPEPQFADQAWPTKVPTLVSLNDSNGLRQNLNLTTGQFFTDADTHTGVERKWTHIAGRVTYSSSPDFNPPTIDSIDAFLSGGVVTFSGRFSDLNETGGPGTVVLAQVVYDVDNTGTWRALPLQFDSASGAWSGGTAFGGAAVQYFVAACDAAGNCGYSSNKGRYFDAQPLPTPSGPITLMPSRPPDRGSWYNGTLSVTPLTSGGGTVSVSVSVDGGPFTSTTSAISLTGNGPHIVNARGSDGTETTGVFLIDGRDPTITHTITPALPSGTNSWYTSAPTVAFSCSDDVSGVVAGDCAIDGSSPAADRVTLGENAAAQSVAATATDGAGNTAHDSVSGLKVDLSDPAVPVITGIVAKAYPLDVPAQSAIACTSSDAISGLLSCVVTGYSSAFGSHTLTATATDKAGRTRVSTLTYFVGFSSGNILAPVTAPSGDQGLATAPDLQVFKLKSTIPVKFRLYLDLAKTMLMTTPPTGSVAKLTFSKADPTTDSSDTPELITVTADSGLVFRWTGSPDYQYIYNWPTAGQTAGTYWVRLTLYASNGTTVLAQSPQQYLVLRS
jgi:hypothetical protein